MSMYLGGFDAPGFLRISIATLLFLGESQFLINYHAKEEKAQQKLESGLLYRAKRRGWGFTNKLSNTCPLQLFSL